MKDKPKLSGLQTGLTVSAGLIGISLMVWAQPAFTIGAALLTICICVMKKYDPPEPPDYTEEQ